MPAPATGQEETALQPLQGENLFISQGSHYAAFTLDRDFTGRIYADISAPPGVTTALVIGNFWLYRQDDIYVGQGRDDDIVTWTAATFHVYLVSTPPVPLSAVLRFEGLPGSASYSLDTRTESFFGPLPEGPLAATAATGDLVNSITRAHGTQWFPGQAFTGFLYHEHSTLVNVDDEREWRWSSPEGIHLCFHDNTAGTGGDGGSTLTIGMALPDGSRSPLNLTLFRQRAVSDPSVSRYAALWIQRAAEDRPTDWTIPIVPLGWSAIQNDPRLDHDTQCALPIAGLLTNLAGMGNIGNPSFQLGTFALGTGEVVYKRA